MSPFPLVLKWYFSLFYRFLSEKVEIFFWESKLFKLKLCQVRNLKNSFQANLRSKVNALSIRKCCFSLFWRFLSDKNETIFWKSKAKPWNLLNQKFVITFPGGQKIISQALSVSGSWLALGNQSFSVRVRMLAMCRGEFSAVIARLMSMK